MDLTIVISNYNTAEFLKKTLKSLYCHIGALKYEVIVVDDASTDSSVNMIMENFTEVRIHLSQKNLGYSKSYNIGTKLAKGRYVLHLNSDVIFKSGELEQAVKYMDKNKEIGLLGCKLIKSNGRLDRPCKRSFPTPLNVFSPKNYYLQYLDEDKTHEVDCLMGAFMMIRREVFHKIGYLDEQFYLYGEDIDFCLRAKRADYKIIYFPTVVAQHYHGATTQLDKWRSLWLFHQAMWLYYRKHLARKYNFLVNLTVYVGISLRFLAFFIFELVRTLFQNSIDNSLPIDKY